MAHKFDSEHVYTVAKPPHRRAANYDKWYMFEVVERNGNDIVFGLRGIKGICNTYPGRVLVSPNTGDEICFITMEGMQVKLDARDCFGKGRRLSQETLNAPVAAEWDEAKGGFVETKDCGTTVEDFLKKKSDIANKE